MRVRVRAVVGRAPERGRGVSLGRPETAGPEAPQTGVVATNQVGDGVGLQSSSNPQQRVPEAT